MKKLTIQTDIETLLIDAATEYLYLDSIDAGHNGPYLDNETSVRNTAHWLMIFTCLFERTKENKYQVAALKAITYLKSDLARPMSASFFCRFKKEKDFCNGLMGQAWVIEALIYADKVFVNEGLYKLAEDVFLLHDFDKERSVWHRTGVDGSRLDFDVTFNHQLWFAAVGSQLKDSPNILNMCDDFFLKIAVKPNLYRNGVLFHNTSIYQSKIEIRKGISAAINYVVQKLFSIKNRKSLYLKSAGYHGFNLYAYELLKERYGDRPFYKSNTFQRMIKVISTKEFQNDLINSPYSYGYNPPGFELGFSLFNNGSNEKDIAKILTKHFSITKKGGGFNSAVSKDFNTSEARLYELIRLLELKNIKFYINEN